MAEALDNFRLGTALQKNPDPPEQRGIFIDDNVGQANSIWGDSPILAARFNPQNYLIYEDHFHSVGYVRDALFFGESDPAGGKFSEVADASEWLVTVVDGGADNGETIKVADDKLGGWLELTTNDANNDLISCQKNGESVKPAAGKKIWWECRLDINDADTADWFIGLADTTTGILAALTDCIGFIVPAGDSAQDLIFVGDKSTAEDQNDTGTDVANTTSLTLGFYVDGISSITCWVGNAIVASAALATANIPIVALSPIIEVRNASAAASILRVDYVVMVAEL